MKGTTEKEWQSCVKPFRLIPNVRDMRIEIQPYDRVFSKHGIRKRMPVRLSFVKLDNEDLNRYIR